MSLTPEQIAMRMSGIGSSEIAACANLYPDTWKQRGTPEKVIAEKLGDAPPFEGNARTRRGDLWEPQIARFWSEQEGRRVTKNGETVRHPSIPFALATVDYFAEGDPKAIVEAKYVGFYVGRHWGDMPPVWVQAQVQWQLGVLGLRYAYVAAIVEGDEGDRLVRSYPIEFDPRAFERLVVIADGVWQRIELERANRSRGVSNG